MTAESQYHVIDIDGTLLGPLDPKALSDLVASWRIGPDSPVRHGGAGDWVTFRDVAQALGIELPASGNWKEDRRAAIASDRSITRWCYAVVAVVVWLVLALLGLGFLFTPIMLMWIVYYILCKVFGAFAGKELYWLPMWTDMRSKPLPGQVLQTVALGLAMFLVTLWYCYRIYGS